LPQGILKFDMALVDAIQEHLRSVPIEEVYEQYGDETILEFVQRILDP